jgi:hypothetical protein
MERPFHAQVFTCLVLFFANLLARSFPSQRSLHTLFFARLQVKGVSLYFLDNVFLLYLPLKTAKSVLEGFPLLKPYFRQSDTPPNPSGWTE